MIRQHIARSVTWDGPLPAGGDYLIGRYGECWLIAAVTIHRTSGASADLLTLELRRFDDALPKTATLHPAARMQPSDPTGPARTRQLATSGPRAVMQTKWRDPTDVIPNASRRPRDITGYRTYCSLRRMAVKKGTRITEAYIWAADQFRGQVDLAAIGASAEREDTPVHGFGPRAGPSSVALMQAYADETARAVLARFAPSSRVMLHAIILHNQTLNWWCTELEALTSKPPDQHVEMGKLLSILEVLADHYGVGTDMRAMADVDA